MKKLMLIAIAASADLIITGCAVTKAEWGGATVVCDKDGVPLVDKDGKVQTVAGATKLYSNRHWFDSSVAAAKLGIKGDEINFELNGYNGGVSSNFVAWTHVLITDSATLATKIGAAIATAGGTAAADGGSGLVAKYMDAGGNVEAANVSCKDGVCTITDGCTTCSDCCYDCAVK